ncbi:MAG TPA: UDP-N-acetylmuramoyl-L-alanine--D-glutamate ligase [Candidatus Limnocylindrales bacterium]|nr:UDP-N-acetylmuramoyl-L-alanine--D-glutamate ligase [Candidatus Limnocylindrales bacterium]
MSLVFDPPVDPNDLAGRRVTILGLGKGRTTAGLARYLVRLGAAVTVSDPQDAEHNHEGLARLGETPVEVVLGPSSDDAALAEPDFVFVIPGIRPRSPTILRALQRDIPVLTEIGLFFRLCPAPIVGVTGTKGKSTTTTLIGRILGRGTRRVLVGGNIGTSVIQDLPGLTADDLVVLELSSFQLETLGRSPHVAVVTNVLEDHLDHHGTREAYAAAKSNIVRWQGPRDIAVLNLDDGGAVALHGGSASEVRGYSLALRPRRGAHLDGNGRIVLADGEQRAVVCAAAELRVPGRHNVGNALAAAVVGRIFDVPVEAIADVLRGFEGLPHRLEAVGEHGGVLWVNDSQATTPFATIPAIEAFDRPAVLILGGVSKDADFGALARAATARARAAILIGRAADEIEAAFSRAGREAGRGPAIERASSLDEAVATARRLAQSGDVVLLSPACASFDMFSSFEERGDRFRELVRAFAAPVGAA